MRRPPRPDPIPSAANDDARGCLSAAGVSAVLIALLIAGARALFIAVRP